MVDKERRKKLAFYLRQLSVGQITNDQFETAISDDVSYGWLPEQYHRANEAKNDDAAILPLLELCWSLYSDLKQHKLYGVNKLNDEQLRHIARWILFLHSELEYEYPYFDVTAPLIKMSIGETLLTLITLGLYQRKARIKRQIEYESFLRIGDHDYWPFFRKEDYERQLAKPPFLNVLADL